MIPKYVPESQIEDMIFTYLKSKNIFCFKIDQVGFWSSAHKAYLKPRSKNRVLGVCDICGIYKGAPLFIEVKKTGGRLAPEQKIFIDRAKKEGAIAFVAHSVDEVKSYLGID